MTEGKNETEEVKEIRILKGITKTIMIMIKAKEGSMMNKNVLRHHKFVIMGLNVIPINS